MDQTYNILYVVGTLMIFFGSQKLIKALPTQEQSSSKPLKAVTIIINFRVCPFIKATVYSVVLC